MKASTLSLIFYSKPFLNISSFRLRLHWPKSSALPLILTNKMRTRPKNTSRTKKGMHLKQQRAPRLELRTPLTFPGARSLRGHLLNTGIPPDQAPSSSQQLSQPSATRSHHGTAAGSGGRALVSPPSSSRRCSRVRAGGSSGRCSQGCPRCAQDLITAHHLPELSRSHPPPASQPWRACFSLQVYCLYFWA